MRLARKATTCLLALAVAQILAAGPRAKAAEVPGPGGAGRGVATRPIGPTGASSAKAPSGPQESTAPPPVAVLRGRVYVRGSLSPLPGAELDVSTGESTFTDDQGRFELRLHPGVVEVLVREPEHEDLRVKETLHAGKALVVEYRLLPRQGARRYQTTARADAKLTGERFQLREEELRTLPGTLGDPFRVVGLLPGVVQPIPVLPLYVVRGASPGMNGFFLDGMQVPQLFHLLVGGGVVHPRMISKLEFLPGGYDASYGRFAGGIIDAETRAARSDGWHLEGELKAYDVALAVEGALPKGVRIAVSGHYGWPGAIIGLIEPGVSLQYGDYQLRLNWKGLTVEALGSVDEVSVNNPSLADFNVALQSRLAFHRVQVRWRGSHRSFRYEAAVVGGIDEMSALSGEGVRKLSIGGRLAGSFHHGPLSLKMGADLELSRFTASSFTTDNAQAAPDELGDLAGDRDGIVSGAYAVADLSLLDGKLETTLSGRVDVYHAQQVTLVGLDPRFSVRVRPMPELSLLANIGLYQQPPSFPVALPGIDTFALSLGLQHAIQASTSIEAHLPQSLVVSATGYYSRFYDMTDVPLDFAPSLCAATPPDSLTGLAASVTGQLNGSGYGMELLLRRTEGRVTGWVAYTLSRADRIYDCGLRPADYDQTHVLNVVLQARLPWNLMAGARLLVSTGRPYTQIQVSGDPSAPRVVADRNNERLPTYVQLDLRLDREWIFQKWALDVFLEVVNATYSQTILAVTYPMVMGIPRFDTPELAGFHWILPSIGLRGRF